MAKKFNTYTFEGDWLASFGKPERNFQMLVYGHPGNGKTEFCMKLSKYLAQFARVYYNSFEQGISQSLQDSLTRNNMQEVAGKIIFGDKENYDEMAARLRRRNAPQVIIIDSRDYMDLTTGQYKALVRANPRKAFIVVCWEKNGHPRGDYAKAIEYMADIKVHVRQFKAYPRSRYGGNVPYIIWNRQPAPSSGQQTLQL